MGTSIHDFGPDDQHQYFSGCTVGFLVRSRRLVGEIRQFRGDGKVVVLADNRTFIVDISDIEWSGTRSPRWVSVGNGIVYIGPQGARTVKKGATTRNLFGLYYAIGDTAPRMLAEGKRARVTTEMIRQYLDDDPLYPTCEDEAMDSLTRTNFVIMGDHDAIMATHMGFRHFWRGMMLPDEVNYRTLVRQLLEEGQ